MRISKEYTFDAAHILPRHKGKCGQLHGHTYTVSIGIESKNVNPETQFVLDYAELDKVVKPLIDKWDHHHLNLFIDYPSAENIATRIAYEVWPILSSIETLDKPQIIIHVMETPKTCAIWRSWDSVDRWRLESSTDTEWKEPKSLDKVKLDVENYFIRRFNNAVIE